MAKTFTVAPGQEFNYPADLVSVQTIRSAGGRSKLQPNQLMLVKFKTVKEGQDCSDMPTESLIIYVARGWVIEREDPKSIFKLSEVVAPSEPVEPAPAKEGE